MQECRRRTIGGPNTTTITVPMYNRLESGGNGSNESVITNIHLFSTIEQHLLYTDGSNDGIWMAATLVHKVENY